MSIPCVTRGPKRRLSQARSAGQNAMLGGNPQQGAFNAIPRHLQENIYIQVLKIDYPSAGEAGRGIVGFLNFSIDTFLEVQNQKYRQILNLINNIAYGLRFWYKIQIYKKNETNYWKPPLCIK